jgi:hypothetical protein
MNAALHPTEARVITVEMYLEEFCSTGGQDNAPRPRCPVCHGALYVAGGNSTKLRPRFSHISRERICCPLVRSGHTPDDIVVSHAPDAALAKLNRQRFLERWQWHFDFMKRPHHAPTLSIERFIALIEYASLKNLWGYEALNLASVPYVLLSYAGFMRAGRGHGHRHGASWLHFWFDTSVRDVRDLHVPRASPPRFFRAHYAHPRTMLLPSQQHLFHMEEVSLTQTYLDADQPTVAAEDVGVFWPYLLQARS